MQKYWFKRKKYGWGWTPATREGWFVTLLFILAVLYFALQIDEVTAVGEAVRGVFVPIVLLVVLFLAVIFKTGEKPRWQWGKKKKGDTSSGG